MRRRAKENAGFTLVELLVSLTLIAILSVLLAAAIRTGARAAGGGEKRMDASDQLVIAETTALRLLAGALPVAVPGKAGLGFDGRPDGVDFVGLPPALSAPGGFYRLGLGAERDGGDLRLMLRAVPVSGGQAATQTVLLDGLSGIEFAYFGGRADGGAAQWHAYWRDAATLPTRIRIRFQARDGRVLPELVVAPRLAAGGAT